MTLALAVKTYVARRRSEGAPFVSSETTLRSLCKWCGDIELSGLTADAVARFVNSSGSSAVTRLSKFSGIKCFIEYWLLRGEVATLTLEKPPRPQFALSPFILSRTQVKALLHASEDWPKNDLIRSCNTLRMILLMLYATGCRVSEVLELRSADINLKRKQICFRSHGIYQERCIPIGAELCSALAEYRSSRGRLNATDEVLYRDQAGRRIKRGNVYKQFKVLLEKAGIHERSDGRGPRLQDLRFAFAVHRIAQCVHEGGDINRLLPALSTYMGYASLTKSEEFLAQVPERFRRDLRKLSPQKGRRRWSRDPGLMCYLGQI